MMKKLFFLFVLCFTVHTITFGQTDNCDNSLLTGFQLTVGASCNPITFDSSNNTDYWDSNYTCGASDRDDAWGWFTATSTLTRITYNSNWDAILTLFTGACNPNMTSLACANSTTSGDETITYATTIGVVYMIRIQRFNTNNTMVGTICVYNAPPPPINDNCAAATLIGVSPSSVCTTSVAGTTLNSTQSLGAINCNGFTGNADDDVWYRFVATTTSHIVTVTPGTLNDAVIDVRSGACNGSNIACADATTGAGTETVTLTGLTPSATYYVRVYSYGGNGSQGTFNICVTVPYNPCTSITNIGACGTTINANFTAGNGSYNLTSCFGGGTPGRELIYSFTPATTGIYNIQQNSSFGWIDYFFKTQAAGCNSTGWTCIGAYNGSATSGNISLTAGVAYYFMLDPESTGGGNVSFNLACPIPPPPNGLCAGAISLPCNASLTGSTVSSPLLANGTGCSLGNYGLWYTFVGDGQQTTISVAPSAGYDIEIAIARGSCAGLINVGCQDALGNGGVENYTFTPTLGVTYFVYVSDYLAGSSRKGSVTVSRTCCYTPPIITTPTCGVVAGGFGLNGANPAPLSCSTGPCVELEANYLNIGNTNSYRVEKIPYGPPPTTATFVSIRNLPDDFWSNARNLPWPFCFYGNSYNEFVFGANGAVTFDTSVATLASGYEFDENLPSTNQALFLNTIYGVYHDVDPSVGGRIGFSSTVFNGCDVFMFVWENVPMYYNGNVGNASKLYSGKIVLYKDTNVIEVHIQEKVLDDYSSGYNDLWNYGNAIVGLQGAAGQSIVAPCRNTNDPNWTVTNEAWRFVPNAGDITELKWYADSGTGFTYLPGFDNDDTPNVCPLVTTTYRAEVTYTPNCGSPFTVFDDVVVTSGNKVWNGSVDTNWYLPVNWTPIGVPVITDCVTIPDKSSTNGRTPIANVSTALTTIPAPASTVARARNIRVLNNGAVEIASNTYLEINEWLNVEPTGSVLIRDTGSLVQLSNVASNNNTGKIYMQRGVTSVGPQDYVYWSSPVESFNVASINTAASEQRYQWNPTTVNVYGNWVPASGIMTVGRGYIVKGLATPPSPIPANNAEFVGRPNNGIINIPITRGNYTGAPYPGAGNSLATNLDDNWNLIGNPYPSAISANSFLSRNAAALTGTSAPIQGTVYLWRHLQAPTTSVDPFYSNYYYNYFASDYIAYNQSGSNPAGFLGNIGAGQGFFVLMSDAVPSGTNVRFDNSMRSSTTPNDQFYRHSNEAENQTNAPLERHRIWLDLITQSDFATSTMVGYIEGATNDNDGLFDGIDLSDSSVRMYSLLGADKLAIQGKALPFDEEDRVPIGFAVPQNGTYKIAINSLDGLFSDPTQNIYLEDTYLNIIYDLRLAPYSFVSDTGTFDDRFILRYTNQTLSTSEEIDNFGFNIIGLNDFIKVTSGKSPINTVTVYDVLGRVLADYTDINALEFKLDLLNQSKGTLIVKATLFNGQQKIKKVIY